MQINNLEFEIENYLIGNASKLKINSKEIKKGDVFVALKGNNTHGNEFISQAKNKGAKYIVTDRTVSKYNYYNCLEVKNIYDFLFIIATKKRNKFNGKIISITGSVGKTSTKEFLNFFLSHKGIISASIQSYNNYLGVLISLINMSLDSVFAIFEVGTNNFNEVKKLTSLILPHQVIITNIYPTHIANFKNTKNIAIEKSDLFNPKYNPNIELVILPNSNKDERFLNELAKKYCIQSIITFGYKSFCDYSIQNIKVISNFLSEVEMKTPFGLTKFKVSTSFKHQIINILIPFIVFKYNKLELGFFLNQTINIPLLKGRGYFYNIIVNNNNVTLIDESYNASPISMKNCISYFENYIVEKNQRKILIIGEMLELGESAIFYHKEIVSMILESSIDKIIFCGKVFKKILSQIKFNSEKILYIANDLKILNFLNNFTLKNDIILAKGSNSSEVNKFVKNLLEMNRRK